jgi:hypothetical protein
MVVMLDIHPSAPWTASFVRNRVVSRVDAPYQVVDVLVREVSNVVVWHGLREARTWCRDDYAHGGDFDRRIYTGLGRTVSSV